MEFWFPLFVHRPHHVVVGRRRRIVAPVATVRRHHLSHVLSNYNLSFLASCTALHVSHIRARGRSCVTRRTPARALYIGQGSRRRRGARDEGRSELCCTRRVRLARARSTNWVETVRAPARYRASLPLRVKVCKKISAPPDTIGSPSSPRPQANLASIGRQSLSFCASKRGSARFELRSPRSLPRRQRTNSGREHTSAASDWRAGRPAPRSTGSPRSGSKTRTLRRTAAKVARERHRLCAGPSVRVGRSRRSVALRHTTKIFLVMEREWTWTRNRANGWCGERCRSPRDGLTCCRRGPLACFPPSIHFRGPKTLRAILSQWQASIDASAFVKDSLVTLNLNIYIWVKKIELGYWSYVRIWWTRDTTY